MHYKNSLVIMPARGGSKRIPQKNIKDICGQPMIHWPLQQLAKRFAAHQVLISTDDDSIAAKVEEKGLTIPFRRPKELSDDYTGTMAVATHALAWYEEKYGTVDYVLIVYPTAVVLNINDIDEAYQTLMTDQTCESVFSATSFAFPIQRAIYEQEDGSVAMFQPKHYYTRSQDLKEGFHDAGQFYWCRADYVRQSLNLMNAKTKIHKLNRENVIDIDTSEDFHIAAKKIKMSGRLENSLQDWYFN